MVPVFVCTHLVFLHSFARFDCSYMAFDRQEGSFGSFENYTLRWIGFFLYLYW